MAVLPFTSCAPRSVRPAGGWLSEGIEGVLGEEDGVACGLGELFDAGGDVDGVADEGELELPAAADGAGDLAPLMCSTQRSRRCWGRWSPTGPATKSAGHSSPPALDLRKHTLIRAISSLIDP